MTFINILIIYTINIGVIIDLLLKEEYLTAPKNVTIVLYIILHLWIEEIFGNQIISNNL